MDPLFELKIEPAQKGARESATNLYRQLRAAIEDGRLKPGTKLPPTRRAGSNLGVSRNTAVGVYERLAHERLVVSRNGSGTYVARAATTNAFDAVRTEAERPDPRLVEFWRASGVTAAIGYWQRPGEAASSPSSLIDLRPAVVDPRLFPFERLRQSFAQQLRRMEKRPASPRGPGGNQGSFNLRSAIAGHVAVTRALACSPEQILVTSGAQQAFDLIARILVRPGETRVAIENPGYPPLRVPFAAAGATIVPIPVDEEGLRVDLVPPDVGIVCASPSHHFPLGVPLSASRRARLRDFAGATGAVIVEDDYDGEFRHEGAPLTALRNGISDDRVFYVGTFSKCMLPSLRLGYVVPPAWALDAMVAAKNALDWHVSSPLQSGVTAFIEQGHLTKHVARMRNVYAERRRAALQAAAEALPAEMRVLPSHYGMHVTTVYDGRSDLEQLAIEARRSGIMVHSLARYFVGPAAMQGLVIGLGTAEQGQLREALMKIGDLARRGGAGLTG